MGNNKHNKFSIFEIIFGSSALIISLCALFVSISQVRLTQQQMHLAVMPRIDISFSSNSSESLNICITNCGLGPAEILAAKVEYESVAVKSWEELFKIMNKDNLKLESFSASKLKDRMLVPMQLFPILTINGKNAHMLIDENKEKIKVTILYRSLYNDYYEVCRENLGVSSSITNKKVDNGNFNEKETFQR